MPNAFEIFTFHAFAGLEINAAATKNKATEVNIAIEKINVNQIKS
jgi:hypothetical protein